MPFRYPKSRNRVIWTLYTAILVINVLIVINVCFVCVCVCSDLSCVQDLQVVILNTFSSQSEEVRSAASYALGTCMLYYTRTYYTKMCVH